MQVLGGGHRAGNENADPATDRTETLQPGWT